MSEQQLIAILSDGDFHSGEELGLALGVSRTAVWKQIKKVEAMGLCLETVKGKGYCLHGGLSLLDKDVVLSAISAQARELITDMDIESVISSTNVQAIDYIQSAKAGSYVCAAEQQTGGKGRRGRAWFSPFGRNLYFSMTWGFASGAAVLEGLSLAVGVVVADVLANYGLAEVQLKWPNDILYDGKKLAGILLEMTGDAAGPCQVVVGIGLNVAMSAVSEDDIDQPWVDVQTLSEQKIDRNKLLADLLSHLTVLLMNYEEQGFAAYKSRFTERDVHLGQPVFVKLGDRLVIGESAGINDSGALILDTEAGRQVFNGGEVSLRGANAT